MAHQEVLRSQQSMGRLTVRDLALTSGLAGLLVMDGYASSAARLVTRNTDTFFLIASFFTVLALMTRKRWTSTLLSVITGLIFFAIPGAPVPVHITISLVANGLAFDLALYGLMMKSLGPEPSRTQLAVAGTVGNGVMAAVALPLVGLYFQVSFPLYVWPIVILGDAFVGLLGVLFGYLLVKRLRVSDRLSLNPVY